MEKQRNIIPICYWCGKEITDPEDERIREDGETLTEFIICKGCNEDEKR